MVIQHGGVCKFGNGGQTCRELRRRSRELARHLRRLSVSPEVRVSVCTGRTDTAVGLLAMLEAGGPCIPFEPYPAPAPSEMPQPPSQETR